MKYDYDALNRLIKVTQPDVQAGDVTSYAYDVQDHLKQVTDAEKNVTTYTYGDRDLLTQEISPVSGIKSYVYNEHGELVQETDARSVIVARTYDALDRVTAVTYPDPSLDVTYAYDTPGAFPRGASRLEVPCTITCSGGMSRFKVGMKVQILCDGFSMPPTSCMPRTNRLS